MILATHEHERKKSTCLFGTLNVRLFIKSFDVILTNVVTNYYTRVVRFVSLPWYYSTNVLITIHFKYASNTGFDDLVLRSHSIQHVVRIMMMLLLLCLTVDSTYVVCSIAIPRVAWTSLLAFAPILATLYWNKYLYLYRDA